MAISRWHIGAWSLLVTGIGAAVVVEPGLLDRPAFTWPLLAGFVVLMMVPRLAALRADRAATEIVNGPVRTPRRHAWPTSRDLRALALGVLAGIALGTGFLAVPGLTGGLAEAKNLMLDLVFGGNDAIGVVVAVAGALVILWVFQLVGTRLMQGVAASRFLGGIAIGVWLWVPFHGTFATWAAYLGLDLPGLSELAGD